MTEIETPPPRLTLWRRFLFFLSIGLGSGLMPKAPGTWGSLLGPPLIWALHVGGQPIPALIGGVICFIIGVPICNVGIDTLQAKDPKQVVFDEIAAFFWVYLFVPVNVWTAVAGFVLFRAFDILKPWPISRVEMLPRGWGVMSDDAVAGMIAGGILAGLYWFTV